MADGFQYPYGEQTYSFTIHIGNYRLDLMAGPGASDYTASTGEITYEQWLEIGCFAPDVELRLFDVTDMEDGKQQPIPFLKNRLTPVSPENIANTYGFCTPADVADALQYMANMAKRGGPQS